MINISAQKLKTINLSFPVSFETAVSLFMEFLRFTLSAKHYLKRFIIKKKRFSTNYDKIKFYGYERQTILTNIYVTKFGTSNAHKT